jgi:hypothetical protein
MPSKKPNVYKAIKGGSMKKGTPKHTGDDMYKSYKRTGNPDYSTNNVEMGITKLCRIASNAKDMKKVNQIADGIRVAQMITKQEGGL